MYSNLFISVIVALATVALALVIAWARGFHKPERSPRLAAVLAFAFHFPLGFSHAFGESPLALANSVAEKTNCGSLTKLADAAISRYRLTKFGTDADHVAVCGAGDLPLGIAYDESEAAEDKLQVALLEATGETRLICASEAIAKDALVFTAANGKIQDEPAVAGTYYLVGRARTAAGADGDIIEVETMGPIKLVVIAALTSTDGTAGAAADLNALKAEAEKIGDDVRAIAAALASASLVKVLAA